MIQSDQLAELKAEVKRLEEKNRILAAENKWVKEQLAKIAALATFN